MASKLVLLVALALIAVVACEAATISDGLNTLQFLRNPLKNEHNLILGHLSFTKDILLYYKLVRVKPVEGEKVTYDVDYSNDDYDLTYIAIINRSLEEDGGYPVLKKGGVGKKNVKVTITSPENEGLTYSVAIFGRE